VVTAPQGAGFAAGDLVVGVVRRPDPVPCPACAGGEWDMCRNGLYTERGIKQQHGYGAERWSLEPEFAVKVDPALGLLGVLLEPTSIVAKAWDHIEGIGGRSRTWRPKTVLVTGAGPIGLLAALLARTRELEVHVLDQVTEGCKPELVAGLGATYHTDLSVVGDLCPDILIECTGAAPVVLAAIEEGARSGVVCLVAVSPAGHNKDFDVGRFNRRTVLRNDVVFGTVNANLAHYRTAAEALARADRAWLARLISRRVPLDRWREAFEKRDDDVKVVIDFQAGRA
jgi:threonine dehydrogenase-like Zn-dependent dehydrogenase